MGKFDGKQITGLVGNLVLKKGTNKTTIVQTKAEQVTQSAATKQSAGLFGIASTLSKTMRKNLLAITGEFYDGGMVNRLTNQNRAILTQCFDKNTEKFTFNETSFSRLAGFEFNLKSPLTSSLWVEPQISLSENHLTVSLPAFEIPGQLKFPDYADKCELKIIICLYILDPALEKYPLFQTIEIDKSQSEVPAQEFVFEVPEGCLCIAGIGLTYFSFYDNIKTVINQKTFNPAGICGAVITPGNFVLPVNPDPHKIKVEWMPMHPLKLPPKDSI